MTLDLNYYYITINNNCYNPITFHNNMTLKRKRTIGYPLRTYVPCQIFSEFLRIYETRFLSTKSKVTQNLCDTVRGGML